LIKNLVMIFCAFFSNTFEFDQKNYGVAAIPYEAWRTRSLCGAAGSSFPTSNQLF